MRIGRFWASVLTLGCWLTGLTSAYFHSIFSETALAGNSDLINIAGGSSDILVVEGRDARIVADPIPGSKRLVLDEDVFDAVQVGLTEGTLQYLSIEKNRFILVYKEEQNAIFAFDCMSQRYLVTPETALHTLD
jgi:hypothetical protein